MARSSGATAPPPAPGRDRSSRANQNRGMTPSSGDCEVTVPCAESAARSRSTRGGGMKRYLVVFLVVFLSVGAFAQAFAQQVTDAWAPQGTQPPIELRVIDPVNGDVEFK